MPLARKNKMTGGSNIPQQFEGHRVHCLPLQQIFWRTQSTQFLQHQEAQKQRLILCIRNALSATQHPNQYTDR